MKVSHLEFMLCFPPPTFVSTVQPSLFHSTLENFISKSIEFTLQFFKLNCVFIAILQTQVFALQFFKLSYVCIAILQTLHPWLRRTFFQRSTTIWVI